MPDNKICAQCGRKIFNNCPEPACKAYWQDYWEKRADNKLSDYQSKVEELKRKEVNELTSKDYSEIKKIQSEVKKWENGLKSSSSYSEIKDFLQLVEALEKQIKSQSNLTKKKEKCSHQNIVWNSFFKSEKTENAYCLDCGDEESNKFSSALQRWYHKKIETWLKSKGLKAYEFDRFLKKEGYFDVWSDVHHGKYEDAVNSFMGQAIMKDIAKRIEEYCLNFAKSKGINDFVETSNNHDSNGLNDKNREREREQKSY